MLVPNIGMYAASTLLIIVFMKWLGRYNWAMTVGIAIGVMIGTFLVFERVVPGAAAEGADRNVSRVLVTSGVMPEQGRGQK